MDGPLVMGPRKQAVVPSRESGDGRKTKPRFRAEHPSAADLFHTDPLFVRCIVVCLTHAPAEQMAELRHVEVPMHAHGFFTALGCARLVHATDRLEVGMVARHNLLALISEFFFIPLDRFEKSL